MTEKSGGVPRNRKSSFDIKLLEEEHIVGLGDLFPLSNAEKIEAVHDSVAPLDTLVHHGDSHQSKNEHIVEQVKGQKHSNESVKSVTVDDDTTQTEGPLEADEEDKEDKNVDLRKSSLNVDVDSIKIKGIEKPREKVNESNDFTADLVTTAVTESTVSTQIGSVLESGKGKDHIDDSLETHLTLIGISEPDVGTVKSKEEKNEFDETDKIHETITKNDKTELIQRLDNIASEEEYIGVGKKVRANESSTEKPDSDHIQKTCVIAFKEEDTNVGEIVAASKNSTRAVDPNLIRKVDIVKLDEKQVDVDKSILPLKDDLDLMKKNHIIESKEKEIYVGETDSVQEASTLHTNANPTKGKNIEGFKDGDKSLDGTVLPLGSSNQHVDTDSSPPRDMVKEALEQKESDETITTFELSAARENGNQTQNKGPVESKVQRNNAEIIFNVGTMPNRAEKGVIENEGMVKINGENEDWDENVIKFDASADIPQYDGIIKIKDPKDCDESVVTFDTSRGRENSAAVKVESFHTNTADLENDAPNSLVNKESISALDHLDALGSTCDVSSTAESMPKTVEPRNEKKDANKNHDDDNSAGTLETDNQKLLLDALLMTSSGGRDRSLSCTSGRERTESWGGMSDISHAGAAAAIAATALHHTRILDDETAPAASVEMPSPILLGTHLMSPNTSATTSLASQSQSSSKSGKQTVPVVTKGVPGKIAVPITENDSSKKDYSDSPASILPRDRLDSFSFVERDRLDSLASLSEMISRNERLDSLASLGDSAVLSRRERLDSLASLGEVSFTMSMSDQLADIAGNLESIVAHAGVDSSSDTERKNSDASGSVSVASSTIANAGANSASTITGVVDSKSAAKNSLPAPTIHVDSEAVQAAVDAAMAATAFLSLGSAGTPTVIPSPSLTSKPTQKKESVSVTSKAKNPLKSDPSLLSTFNEEEMEVIRARARAAAGYVHPINGGQGSDPSSKKRPRPLKSNPSAIASYLPPTKKRGGFATISAGVPGTPAYDRKAGHRFGTYLTPIKYISSVPGTPFSTTPKRKNISSKRNQRGTPQSLTSPKGGQSNQKWDEMFEALLQYKEEQRKKETEELSDAEKVDWTWEGNVPTTYKTKEGKALGRWINNQRSAKSKGSLKRDREERLLSTGLKWSVLTTNPWGDMMEELRIYVKEKTKDGKDWDGNVPTNYRIKGNTAADGTEIDEDKNLGRWINRQRSLYQSGKLKKERQLELEEIGLKWAVLSTTSWQAMYEALCEYCETRKDASPSSTWDGNVPCSYETDDKPPKRLGRWVNRQRSAYATKRLKEEFVLKLEKIGLKWTAHDKKMPGNDEKDFMLEEDSFSRSDAVDAIGNSKELSISNFPDKEPSQNSNNTISLNEKKVIVDNVNSKETMAVESV